jgi:hypothetical protein
MGGVLPVLGLLAVVIFAAPTAVVIAVLLLPSALARAADSTPGHPLTQTVLLFGCAGIVPYLDRLWHVGNHLPEAIGLATDMQVIALCWALQAAGWLLGQVIPLALAAITRRELARHRMALEQRRAALETEWDWH